MLIITSKINKTQPGGVRLVSLFEGYQNIHENTLMVHSKSSDGITGWITKVVNKGVSNRRMRLLGMLTRRYLIRDFVLDEYCFTLHNYKKVLMGHLRDTPESTVLICCAPYSLLLLAKIIKSLAPETHLILDLGDPFSFNMSFSRIRSYIARHIEKKYLPYYEKIVVLNEVQQERYMSMYPAISYKFIVIEQGIDESFVLSARKKQPHKKRKFTFIYAGAFYKKGRTANYLFRSIKHFENCKLKIYTSAEWARKLVKSKNVEWNGRISRNELAIATSEADAIVIIDNDYGCHVPGKTLESLALEKPVLFIYNNENSPSLKYVQQARGVVIAKNDEDSISQAITLIICGNYNQPFFDYSPYTWSTIRAKYRDLLL